MALLVTYFRIQNRARLQYQPRTVTTDTYRSRFPCDGNQSVPISDPPPTCVAWRWSRPSMPAPAATFADGRIRRTRICRPLHFAWQPAVGVARGCRWGWAAKGGKGTGGMGPRPEYAGESGGGRKEPGGVAASGRRRYRGDLIFCPC